MRASPDVTGQRFGRWQAIHRVEAIGVSFFCRCECGTERVVKVPALISGRSASCGSCLTTRGWSVPDKLLHHSMPEPNSGCWLWLATTNDHGYGRMTWRGREQLAHRLSYEAFVAPIPSGLRVLHKCDVPLCINPQHLFLGTHADNMADMVRKGRHAPCEGENGGNAVLTKRQALEIYHADEPHRIIAAKHGVSRSTVSMIKRREIWRSLHQSGNCPRGEL